MGVPRNHPFIEGIFHYNHYKPSSYWGISILGNPQMVGFIVAVILEILGLGYNKRKKRIQKRIHHPIDGGNPKEPPIFYRRILHH